MILFNVHLINIILWLGVGATIGLLSSFVFSGNAKGGMFITITLAISGALLAGFISSRIFSLNVTSLNTEAALAALTGAIILSLVHRFAFKQKQFIRTRISNLQ